MGTKPRCDRLVVEKAEKCHTNAAIKTRWGTIDSVSVDFGAFVQVILCRGKYYDGSEKWLVRPARRLPNWKRARDIVDNQKPHSYAPNVKVERIEKSSQNQTKNKPYDTYRLTVDADRRVQLSCPIGSPT
jgi:hypothetical protein